MTNEQIPLIIEEVVKELERIITQIDARLEALENETGVHILNGYDEDRTDYPHNTLAKTGGGALQQYDAESKTWRVVVNTIESVDIVQADGTAMLRLEKSDGTIVERLIPYAKAPRRKAVAL